MRNFRGSDLPSFNSPFCLGRSYNHVWNSEFSDSIEVEVVFALLPLALLIEGSKEQLLHLLHAVRVELVRVLLDRVHPAQELLLVLNLVFLRLQLDRLWLG